MDLFRTHWMCHKGEARERYVRNDTLRATLQQTSSGTSRPWQWALVGSRHDHVLELDV
jgi:hypothetical protein